jgi:hypothetical protein
MLHCQCGIAGAMGLHISQPNNIFEADKLDDDDSVEKLKADLADAHAQVVLTAAAVTIIDREDEGTFKCYATQEDLDTKVPGDTNALSNNPANQLSPPMAEQHSANPLSQPMAEQLSTFEPNHFPDYTTVHLKLSKMNDLDVWLMLRMKSYVGFS